MTFILWEWHYEIFWATEDVRAIAIVLCFFGVSILHFFRVFFLLFFVVVFFLVFCSFWLLPSVSLRHLPSCFFPLLLFQLAFALATGHCFSRSAGLAHGSWSLRHFAYGFHPCGTLRVPNFVTRDRLDSQSLRFACPSVLLPPPSSKKSQERLAARKGRKNTPKATPKATQKKTQKKHTQKRKKTQKNAKKMQKKCKKLEVFLVFLNFIGCSGLLWRGPVFFLFRFRVFFRVFFLWSLSLLRWVLFFSRVFSVFLPAICIGILFWLYSPLILGCAPVFCLRFHLVLIVALQLAVWSANLHRAGHLKLESLDWRNIAKHQTRHGKQKKPRSNTKKHHPQTVQKKRKNNRKKNTKKTQKKCKIETPKKHQKNAKQLKSTILASG